MKVAGGMLMAIGSLLAVISLLYQNDTGNSSPLTIVLGVIIFFIGLVVFNMKPKDKKE